MNLNEVFSIDELVIILTALTSEEQLYKKELERIKGLSEEIEEKYKKRIETIENIIRKFE